MALAAAAVMAVRFFDFTMLCTVCQAALFLGRLCCTVLLRLWLQALPGCSELASSGLVQKYSNNNSR